MDAELAHLRLQLDAATKKNSMLGQQLNTELVKKSSQLEAETKTNEGLLHQLRGEGNKRSLLHQQLDDEMNKNSKVLQRLSAETKKNSKVLQQLDAEQKKNDRLLQQLDTEQKKSGEAEQLQLRNAQTIRNLRRHNIWQMQQLNVAAYKSEAGHLAQVRAQQYESGRPGRGQEAATAADRGAS